MDAQNFLNFLHTAEKLKTIPRHCQCSDGSIESVAEHTWRMALMAMLLKEEPDFENVDFSHLIQMILVHDLGEIATGDIPVFIKSSSDTQTEQDALHRVVCDLPPKMQEQIADLVEEYNQKQTAASKLCKALDKLEAVIQHNESDLSSWLGLEYKLNLTHGSEECLPYPLLSKVRQLTREETQKKIATEKYKSR